MEPQTCAPLHRTMLFVHIDLKGLPLTPDYLCARFVEMRAAGATHILLEWEDMLPWSGDLAVLACPHAFTAKEVERVLKAARELDLEVVPLVQTLGHLEFVLKHNAFAPLREDRDDFGTLCPVNQQAHQLVGNMLSQVATLHPYSTKVHIGCDEPTLGVHAETVSASASDADGLAGVLVGHVQRTALAARSLGCECLMWHDSGMGMEERCLERLLGTGVTLIIWDYRPQLDNATVRFADTLTSRAQGVPPLLATAYKGGDAPDAVIPKEEDRMSNQRAWLQYVGRRQTAPTPIAGVVLTGWSRFGHLMPLTEMLAVAMPVLLRSLAMWTAAAQSSGVEHLVKSHKCEVPVEWSGAAQSSGAQPRGALLGSELAAEQLVTRVEAASGERAQQLVDQWRQTEGSGVALLDACVELVALSSEIRRLEDEWRQQTRPVTARAPSPKLVRRVLERVAGEQGVAARLELLCRRMAVLMNEGICRCDVDEWLAKVLTGARATQPPGPHPPTSHPAHKSDIPSPDPNVRRRWRRTHVQSG